MIRSLADSLIDALLEASGLDEAYSERTKKSALNAANDFHKTGHMHLSDTYDDGNYFKIHLIDKEHPKIKAQMASKDPTTPAGRLMHNNPDEAAKIVASPHRYHPVTEFSMNWQSGRPDPKDPHSYYTSAHYEGHHSMADAIKAHHNDSDDKYGSKRSQALHDLLQAGEIK